MYGYVGIIYVSRLSADKALRYCRFSYLCPGSNVVLVFVLRDNIRYGVYS